ncbi:hypothetical protein TBLA_0C03690 [Henningerozyma blattae CBS 6284]|uniref:CAF1B/HIR1 beta-propeller domain-containing protein n=1 Tax=Henningerozyma blattae (strain ATCC 34711 / CBS 6284 / DSM 70876 / NBRC 10599 / NRRL Y-10934 / UCD 77-7) TaxID=1071380 RepID=I2H1C0_HENB6|nr:hypothetical protein TBLA_0C03690 [Tetrapisispora blattae CBS 6284]CCH60172.1 hypothetical protein TBLA_0C03690 [Tetrapisispora blattae CBS 6284]
MQEKITALNLQIYWHESQPIYSLSFSNFYNDEEYTLYTAGGDNKIRQWKINMVNKSEDSSNPLISAMDTSSNKTNNNIIEIEHVREIGEHAQAVNSVCVSPLFQQNEGDSCTDSLSPTQARTVEYISSTGDDGVLQLWSITHSNQKSDTDGPSQLWRTHIRGLNSMTAGAASELYDISWSPKGDRIAVAGMDGKINLFNTSNGEPSIIENIKLKGEPQLNGQSSDDSSNHNACIQGIAWDPRDQYIVTQGVDRAVNILRTNNLKLEKRICKDPISKKHFFHNDTLVSFFRRPSWSPCGILLALPSGLYDNLNCVLIYTRNNLQNPSIALPGLSRPAIAIAWSPIIYEFVGNTNTEKRPLINLPYKMLIAIATTTQIIIYDTSSIEPVSIIGNLHYTPITDLVMVS